MARILQRLAVVAHCALACAVVSAAAPQHVMDGDLVTTGNMRAEQGISALGDIRTSEGLKTDYVDFKNDGTGRAIRQYTDYLSDEIPLMITKNATEDRATWWYLMPNGTPLGNGVTSTQTLQRGGISSLKLFDTEYPENSTSYGVMSLHTAYGYSVFNSKRQGSTNAYPFLWTIDDNVSIAKADRNTFIYNKTMGSGNIFELRQGTGQVTVDTLLGQFTTFGAKYFWVDSSGNATTTGTSTIGSTLFLPSYTSTQVPFIGTSGQVTGDANLTYNNTQDNLTAAIWQTPMSDANAVLYVGFESNASPGIDNLTNDWRSPTITGSPAAAGVVNDAAGRSSIGNCLTFDGTDDNIHFGDNYDQGTRDFSISFWFTRASAVTGNKYVMDKRNSGFTGFSMYMSATGVLNIEFGSGSAIAGSITSSGWNDGNWHHVVVTFDRDGNASGYVDGILRTTRSISGASATNLDNNGNYIIGDARTGSADWNGNIDEYIHFDGVVLTPAQVKGLYHATAPFQGHNDQFFLGDFKVGGNAEFDGLVRADSGSPGTNDIATAAGELYIEGDGEFDGNLYVGGYVARKPTTVALTGNSQTIAVASSSVRLTSNGTLTDIRVADGALDGQVLVIHGPPTNSVKIVDANAATTNCILSADITFDADDTLSLEWNGSDWRETGRSIN